MKPGVTLANWDISDKLPEANVWDGQRGYFVMVTHGLESPELNFTLDLEVICAVRMFDSYLQCWFVSLYSKGYGS